MRKNLPLDLILGGGPAGLFWAHFAHQNGYRVQLLEAEDKVGGAARTIDWNGFRYDTGAHRWHDVYPDLTQEISSLLGGALSKVSAPSQIYFDGRFLDFPLTPRTLLDNLPLTEIARGLASLAKGRLTFGSNSFSDFAVKCYGRHFSNLFLLPYTEKLWGAPGHELLPEVSGKRLHGLGLFTFLYDLFRRKERHLDGHFLYPIGGIGEISSAIERKLPEGSLNIGKRVTEIHHEGGVVREVRVGEEIFKADRYVVTLPLSLTLSLMRPLPSSALLECTRALRFRHVVVVFVALNRTRVSSNASLYFPTKKVCITRAVEPRNRSSAMSPPGQTSLACEIPCYEEDSFWNSSDVALRERVVQDLVNIGLIERSEVLGGMVTRIKNAYPVLTRDSLSCMKRAREFFDSFTNLRMMGRSAQFSYQHLHGLMREARDEFHSPLHLSKK